MRATPPKNILITGASSGIGAALARHYAASGITLYLGGRDDTRLNAVADACRTKGATVQSALVDVTDKTAMQTWIEQADDQTVLDLVIANAGVSAGTGGGAETPEQAAQIFRINVDGVLNTTGPILPRFAARRRGQVAIMSSLAGYCGWPGAPAYSASKGAVRFYGLALRGALKGRNVRVNVICPGFIVTPMTNNNPFPMPFILQPETAARRIAKGLAADKACLAFPWPTAVMARLVAFLPLGLRSLLPAKPAEPRKFG